MRRRSAAAALLIAVAATACNATGNQPGPSPAAVHGQTQQATHRPRLAPTQPVVKSPVAPSALGPRQGAANAPGSFTPAGFGNNLPNGGYQGARQTGCGVERWHVKTGTDSGAIKVDTSRPQSVSIAQLADAPAPSNPADTRYGPVETHTWTLHAVLTDYKKEVDSDYHLALIDTSGRSMIAEIPAPDCTGSPTPWLGRIAASRSAFDAKFSTTDRYQETITEVTITGVGYFDRLHGQRGVATNGVELHPVLALTFR